VWAWWLSAGFAVSSTAGRSTSSYSFQAEVSGSLSKVNTPVFAASSLIYECTEDDTELHTLCAEDCTLVGRGFLQFFQVRAFMFTGLESASLRHDCRDLKQNNKVLIFKNLNLKLLRFQGDEGCQYVCLSENIAATIKLVEMVDGI